MSESYPIPLVAGGPDWEPRVLVVDDDPICRIAAKGLLERLGLVADIAADGHEAVRLATQRAYTAIFMDCYMPELDGYETTREIRAHSEAHHAPPVIALTSHPRYACLSAGLDYHIAKPLRIEALREDCTSLGLLPWTGAVAETGEGAVAQDGPGPVLDRSLQELPLLSGHQGLAGSPGPDSAAIFARRAIARLPRLWRSANLRDREALSETAAELQQGAMGVGAARIAWLCDRMTDAAAHHRVELATSFEPLIRQAVNETAAAAQALATAAGDAPGAADPPAGAAAVPPAPVRAVAVTAPASWAPPSGSVRVAIADDDPLARMAIEAMVKRGDRLEFVGAAADVPEMLALVEAQRPDVAIVDIVMPGGGGAEAARRIRTESPDTRVIALTAFDTPGAYLEMLRAGAAGLLVKGCTAERFVQMVHTAAERLAA
jgi:CheY-like chemotaxis protein